MTDHLPECMHSDEWQPYCCPECTPGVVPEWEQVCICDRLRACEERVKGHRLSYENGVEVGYDKGHVAGLDAAREAVVPQNVRSAYLVSLSPQEQRIAVSALELAARAIDALREEQA